MKLVALVYEDKINLDKFSKSDKIDDKNFNMIAGEIPIYINNKNAICHEIIIEDTIKLRDYLKQRKLGEEDIDYIAQEAAYNMMPNASNKDKEKAKEAYLDSMKRRQLKAFIFSIRDSSDKSTNIIVLSASIKNSILDHLWVKENMTNNLLVKLGVSINDLLLWLYWRSATDPHLSTILIKNITKDETGDRSSTARSQTEVGGDEILDSSDLKYRVGTGFPLKSMAFKLKEEDLGANIEIGIFEEDRTECALTISGFYPNKTLADQLESTQDPKKQKEIYSKALGLNMIYRLVQEYHSDYDRWQSEKPIFISRLAQESIPANQSKT